VHRITSTCIIYYPQRVRVQSRDLFKLWEIRDNISLTVQDRDIVVVVMED